jgi:hypothetical protein
VEIIPEESASVALPATPEVDSTDIRNEELEALFEQLDSVVLPTTNPVQDLGGKAKLPSELHFERAEELALESECLRRETPIAQGNPFFPTQENRKKLNPAAAKIF